MKNVIRISLGLAAALASQQLLARTEISSLPFTANEAGETYVLSADLRSASGAAITVAADDVVIDGAGNTITYADSGAGNGVLINSATKGLEVKNLTLSQGGYDPSSGENVHAIYGRGDISNLNIHHNTLSINHTGAVSGAYGAGISLSNNSQRSWGNQIAYNTISVRGTSGGYGIAITPNAVWQGRIYGNQVTLAEMGRQPAGYGRAIAISGRGPVHIYRNRLDLASSVEQVQGISLWGGSGHTIRDNEIVAASSHTRAILIDGNSDDNVVYRNKIKMSSGPTGGASAGIRIRYGSDRTLVHMNDIDVTEGQDSFALRLGNGEGFGIPKGTIIRDNVLRSASRALSVEEGGDTIFYNNRIEGVSGGYAVYIAGPTSGLSFNKDKIDGGVHFIADSVRDVEFCGTGLSEQAVTRGVGNHEYRIHEGECSYPSKDVPLAPANVSTR